MKLRSDFVTNSSSASTVCVKVVSEPIARLVLMVQRYPDCPSILREMSVHDGREVVYEEGEDGDYGHLGPTSSFSEFLRLWTEPIEECTQEERSRTGRRFLQQMYQNQEELQDSIEEVCWDYIDWGWGGDHLARYYRYSYSEERLEEILKAIAAKNGCDVSDISDEDFERYVGGFTSVEKTCFTYRRDTGAESYSRDFYLQ